VPILLTIKWLSVDTDKVNDLVATKNDKSAQKSTFKPVSLPLYTEKR